MLWSRLPEQSCSPHQDREPGRGGGGERGGQGVYISSSTSKSLNAQKKSKYIVHVESCRWRKYLSNAGALEQTYRLAVVKHATLEPVDTT